MPIEPINAQTPHLNPAREAAAPIARSGQIVSLSAQGKAGPETITGMVVNMKAPTSTDPGYLTVYDIKNKRVVIKSPAPGNIASA